MFAETIPLCCTRVYEWNTSIVKGFIVKLSSMPSSKRMYFFFTLRHRSLHDRNGMHKVRLKFVGCIFWPAFWVLSHCVFRSALGCSLFTDISYHDNIIVLNKSSAIWLTKNFLLIMGKCLPIIQICLSFHCPGIEWWLSFL